MPVLLESRINTLKSYIEQAPQFMAPRKEDLIELYAQRKTLRYNTALNYVKLSATNYTSKDSDKNMIKISINSMKYIINIYISL